MIVWWIVSRQVEGMDPIHLTETPLFYLSLTALVLSVQSLLTGFLAELTTSYNTRDVDVYSVKQRVGGEAADESESN